MTFSPFISKPSRHSNPAYNNAHSNFTGLRGKTSLTTFLPDTAGAKDVRLLFFGYLSSKTTKRGSYTPMADEQFEDGALSEAELDALINSVSGTSADSDSGSMAYTAGIGDAEPDPLADALGGGHSTAGYSASAGSGNSGGQAAGLRMSTFDEGNAYGAASGGLNGFDRVQDIPLELTVELGRTRLLIKDILELGSGSIVELEKVAGEPVDLLANGLLIARGEVVVIEDSFGVRITEIITSAERKTVGGGNSAEQKPMPATQAA